MRSYFVYLSRHKLYTAINVGGLGLAFAFILLVASFVVKQKYTDSHHEKAENIYLLCSEKGGWSSYWMHKYLMSEFGDRIDAATSLSISRGTTFANDMDIVQRLLFADSLFFDIFTYDIVEGDIEDFKKSTKCAVISEEYARDVFDDGDPIGDKIYVNNIGYEIVAVMKEPSNTVLAANVILSAYESMTIFDTNAPEMHTFGNCLTALLIKEDVDKEQLMADITEYLKEKWVILQSGFITELKLVNFREAYFTGDYDELLPQGNKRLMIFISILGIVLAIFVGRIYVSLTLAQSSARLKEMAIRQLTGTSRRGIIGRTFMESLVITIFYMGVAIIMAYIFEPMASELMDYEFEVFDEFRWWHYLCFIGLCLLISSLATISPSIVISKSKPIDIVRHKIKNRVRHSGNLVSSHYALCFMLLIPTIAIWMQLRHLIDAPLGYNTEDILVLEPGATTRLDTLREKLMELECVEKVGFCDGIPLQAHDQDLIRVDEQDYFFNKVRGDSTFMEIMGIHLTKRFVEEPGPPRRVEGNHVFVNSYINDKGAELLGVSKENPEFVTNMGRVYGHLTIMGTYNDFMSGTILNECPYTSVACWGTDINNIIKMNPSTLVIKTRGDHKKARASIVRAYNEVYPELVKNLGEAAMYIDQHIEKAYEYEKRIMKISTIFTGLCVFTTILGLYASVLFSIGQMRQFIGIWRVCGGTTWMISQYFIKMYMKVITLSFIVVLPVAYWLSEYWLGRFVYRIDHPYIVYLQVYAIGALIAVGTVVLLTSRILTQRPVELLAKDQTH